jgi:hypothetical protein
MLEKLTWREREREDDTTDEDYKRTMVPGAEPRSN